MESFFERIENIRAWESYIRTFQTIGVTDEELSAAMIDAIFISNEELLYRLIADTRSGRRVFKQLCHKGTIPYIVSLDLHTRQELDLAFNVVVGKRLWSYALELYHHPDVTQISRRQALQCAIREGSWDTVKQLVVSSVTPERDRRQAFLAAVRQNELAWAVHLCEQDVSVSDGDIRFAIKTCLATGQNQFVHMFLQLCANVTGLYKCLKCILKESIHSGAVVVLTENHQVSEYFESMEIGTYVDIEQPRINQESAIAIGFPADEGYLNVPGISAHDDGSHPTANTATLDGVYSVCLQVQGNNPDDTTDDSKDLPLYIIREAVKASNAGCFRLLCFQFADNEAILRYAFKKAMTAGESEMVLKTIDVCEHPHLQHTRMLCLAVKLGMKKENFDFVKQVVDAHKECLSWSNFFLLETGYIKAAKNWAVAMPILESLILSSYEYWVIVHMKCEIGQRKVKLLARWCMQNECTRLALFLALESQQWRLARRIIECMSTPILRPVFDIVFDKALSEREWRLAVACLRQAPEDTELEPGMFWNLHGETKTLIQHCRSEGLTYWVIQVGVCSENWQLVETEMESCDDESIFNFVLKEAAISDQWDLVSKLLDKCTGREPCLHKVLTCAVEMGNCLCAKKLLNLIDPLAGATSEFDPLLITAIESENEEMIDFCIQSGVSTHHEADDMYMSPMKRYLSVYNFGSANISVVKALFESGACCHDELSQLKNQPFVKMRLQTSVHREVLENYMEAASSTPRSLRSLCRLSVSHEIGCQPGRENRILSLPVPQLIKDFIMFKDILVAP
ncbi:hypothetical protein V1264_023195 [Littorina saxatilis]|uniref:SOCS box domain-containing protein n=1 Tax=Littorina saxatilis TaxID=31220 RepID=A0AAN9B7V6_9CAEN